MYKICNSTIKTINKKKFDRESFLTSQPWRNPEEFLNVVLESKWYFAISLFLSEIQINTRDFYKKYKFASIPMPITSSSISSPFGLGSDSEPVQIELFNKTTYLSDSMQFHLEYLIRQKFKGVYYIMPTFRGENPDERHLNQFFHSELEIDGTLDDVMNIIDKYIKYCIKNIFIKYGELIEELGGGVDHIEKFLDKNYTIPRISFEEALTILECSPKFYKFVNKKIVNISAEGERALLKKFNGPVWIMYYPIQTVPFYQAWNSDNVHAMCADLLMGIGEIVGCGQRHSTYLETLVALDHHKVNRNEYEWYLKMKKEYPLQTSGFGMGIERLLLWLLNHNDIRDVTLFNRLKGYESAP